VENIERGFLNIAAVCGLAGDTNVVKRWLSNLPETWLVIFDNADDPELDISTYFPVGDRGTILITTRNPDCKNHATSGSWWEVGRMEIDEAVNLMLKTSGFHDFHDKTAREMAEPVVLTLGCLALAITHAGAVIRQGVCRMDEYCQFYARHRKELLGQKGIQNNGDYRYTVYTTWEVSLGIIEAKSSDVAQDAVELLQIFSFLHHEGISEEMFHQAWKGIKNRKRSDWIYGHQPRILLRQNAQDWDSYVLRKAMSILLSFSLISRDKNDLISIHPLVHMWARDRMSRPEEEQIWMLALSTLAMSIPRDFQLSDYRLRQSQLPHINACLAFHDDGVFHLRDVGKECLEMAETFALTYSEAGRRPQALQLIEQLVEISKRTLGEEHPDALRSMHNLAVQYNNTGRRPEALQLTERVFEIRKRTLGEEHLDTLRSMHSLAVYYNGAGRRPEALQLMERVFETYKRTLGEEHPDTLHSMHSLAVQYNDTGRRPDALQLTERVFEIRKRTLGEEHPDTLNSMHNLAVYYIEAGRRPEALQLAERVVEIRKRTLGEEHPDTLDSMHNLAICYRETGQRPEARRRRTFGTIWRRMMHK
jgi:tetratricopeptide (TPR) repeat protein